MNRKADRIERFLELFVLACEHCRCLRLDWTCRKTHRKIYELEKSANMSLHNGTAVLSARKDCISLEAIGSPDCVLKQSLYTKRKHQLPGFPQLAVAALSTLILSGGAASLGMIFAGSASGQSSSPLPLPQRLS